MQLLPICSITGLGKGSGRSCEFDEFFGFLVGMHDYFDSNLGTHWKQGKNRPHYMPIYEDTKRVSSVGYLTEAFTDRAVTFIRNHEAQPFFLYLAYNAIHTPHQAPGNYLARYEKMDPKEAGWRAMLDILDDGVGKILDVLEQSSIEKNTIVIFIGDNGAHIPEGNWKFRGQKGSFFEGGIRVPWLVRWPSCLKEGIYQEPVMHIDILPTLLAAANVELPEKHQMDGVNLLPYWRSSKPDVLQRSLFWGRTNGTRYAVRKGAWKLIREINKPANEQVFSLYNLEKNPKESQDLLDTNPHIVSNLSKLYENWVQCIRDNDSK